MTTTMDLYEPLLAYRDAQFKAHCAYILETYLDPWINFFYLQPPRYAGLEAVIVDTRPSSVLRAVILNAMLMLPAGTPLILITSEQAFAAMSSLLGDLGEALEIRALPLGTNFNLSAYNQLLSNSQFWHDLSADSIFIFQSDSLLLTPLPESLLTVPYLGAPWSIDGALTIDFPCDQDDHQGEAKDPGSLVARASLELSPGLADIVPHGYGNGGLSLRNRELMASIAAEQTRENWEPEDVFFSRHLPSYCTELPPLELAQAFASEAIYSDAIGIHASWKYLPAEQQASLYEKHIKNLIAMAEGLMA
jgi:hypothetical protein